MTNEITSESHCGPVYIKSGEYSGRIGYLEDDEDGLGVVNFGDGLHYLTCANIPYRHLSHVNSDLLINRKNDLFKHVSSYHLGSHDYGGVDFYIERLDLLYEYRYIEHLLIERWERARWETKDEAGLSIFISHSSKDKVFARMLSVDLAHLGHKPWLDEWNILPGESIVSMVGAGIEKSDYVLLILTPDAVTSKWVETEWQAKYWDEITTRNIKLIPIMHEQCEVPALIKPKKYVDFTYDYAKAFDELASAFSTYIKQTKV